jgi:hypothetical protein
MKLSIRHTVSVAGLGGSEAESSDNSGSGGGDSSSTGRKRLRPQETRGSSSGGAGAFTTSCSMTAAASPHNALAPMTVTFTFYSSYSGEARKLSLVTTAQSTVAQLRIQLASQLRLRRGAELALWTIPFESTSGSDGACTTWYEGDSLVPCSDTETVQQLLDRVPDDDSLALNIRAAEPVEVSAEVACTVRLGTCTLFWRFCLNLFYRVCR